MYRISLLMIQIILAICIRYVCRMKVEIEHQELSCLGQNWGFHFIKVTARDKVLIMARPLCGISQHPTGNHPTTSGERFAI